MIQFALPFTKKQYHRMGAMLPSSWAAAQVGKQLLANSIALKPGSAIDTSFYNGPIDFSKVSPLPFGIIPKATEWGSVDADFASTWNQAGAMGSPRMAYHFFHFNQLWYTSARQAKTFTDPIIAQGPIKPNDYFIIDAEEVDAKGASMLSIGQIVDFLWNVQVNLKLADPSHLLIYSTAGMLNALSMAKLTPEQRTWLKQVRIFVAGYPNDPDAFSSIPPAYQTNQNFGPEILWQYWDAYMYTGISGSTDVDWVDKTFAKEWASGAVVVVPPPTPTPDTIKAITVTVDTSDPNATLSKVLVDGVDDTARSTLLLSVTTITPPAPPPIVITPPPPVPQPAPIVVAPWSGDGIPDWWPKVDGIWSLRNREELTPPLVHDGSFNAMGGHGQTCWIELGPNEIHLFRTCYKDNEALWPGWAVSPEDIHIFIGKPDMDLHGQVVIDPDGKEHFSRVQWPIINSGSTNFSRNYGRQMAAATHKYNGVPFDDILFQGIPYQANGDYSAWTPDKTPWCYNFCWTDFKPGPNDPPPGGYGASKAGLYCLMPIWDPRGFPKVSSDAASLGGNWIHKLYLRTQLS